LGSVRAGVSFGDGMGSRGRSGEPRAGRTDPGAEEDRNDNQHAPHLEGGV
jgi:hypothetical protein